MSPALELINSEWWRGRPDGPVEKLPDVLDALGFGDLGAPPAALVELRALLRRLVERPTAADRGRLASFVARGTVRRRLAPDGSIELEPARRDWDWALSELAASFVPLLAEPSRLKICANHECQWAFYDASRNRSRRWCGAASCGTLDKVRRFRERQRAHSGRA